MQRGVKLLIGLQQTQRIVNSKAFALQANNSKVAQNLGLNVQMDFQTVNNIAAFSYQSNESNQSRNAENKLTQSNQQSKAFEILDNLASDSSKYAIEKLSESLDTRTADRIERMKEAYVRSLLNQVDLCKLKSYGGDFESFKTIIDYAQGKFTAMMEGLDLSEVSLSAAQAIEQLVKDSPDYPALLGMIISSQLLIESQHQELTDAPAKLMNKSSHSQEAMTVFKNLLNKGSIRLEDFAERAIELDPTSAVVALTKLAVGSSDKSQTLTAVNLLSKVARESSGTMAGSKAAKGLKKVIKVHSNQQIVDAAFDGLKKASSAGNGEALKSITELAKDPTISQNKAFKAVDTLKDLATTNSPAGGQATDFLVDIATDKKVSTKVRFKSIDSLGEVAAAGNANSKKASDGLLKIARNPESAMGARALDNILSLKKTDQFDQDNLSKVLFMAAKSNRLDRKTKIAAYNKLENIFDEQAGGGGAAKKCLLSLAQRPDTEIGRRALSKAGKMNESSATKSPETMQLAQAFQLGNLFRNNQKNIFSSSLI